MKHVLIKFFQTGVVSVVGLLVSFVPAFAHVVVKPTSVGVGAFQTFSVGVPNEKDTPTVFVKLIIPEGLNYVSPNVKPGWTITIKKSGEGDSAKVTQIDWSGGTIPPGQRDDFVFSAQVPASESTLIWKAYQTYQNGDVVSWDQEPTDSDSEKVMPYSTTKVINDLANAAAVVTTQKNEIHTDRAWQSLTMLALVLSVLSIGIQLRKRV